MWNLSLNKATLYYGTNRMPIQAYKMIKFEYDDSYYAYN